MATAPKTAQSPEQKEIAALKRANNVLKKRLDDLENRLKKRFGAL